jgi:AmiR/NasT family two-component response regulator
VVGTGTALVADEDAEVIESLTAALEQLGWDVVEAAYFPEEVEPAVETHEPDIVVIGVHANEAHALDLVETVAGLALAPVIAALPEEDAEFVAEAAERGIVSYASGLGEEALASAIALARRRHGERRELGAQIAGMENRLRVGAQVEQARGVLMERHDIDADTAYERMRSYARQHRRGLADCAGEILDGTLRL